MNISTLFVAFLGLFALQVCAHPLEAQSVNASSPDSLLSAAAAFNLKAPRRGVSFRDVKYIQQMCGGQMSWAYNWDSRFPDGFPSCLKYVPMLWGNGATYTDRWAANVDYAISKGVRQMMSFNEPDGCGSGQACISAQAAVDAYKKYMMPLRARGVQIGGPAITNGPKGLPWLKDFLTKCTGCVFDFQPLHMYDVATNAAYFRNYLSDMIVLMPNRQIWLTELHGSGSTEQQITFLKTIMPWMDNNAWISGYAYMMASPTYKLGPLVQQNAQLTPLGKVYKDTPF